MKTDAESLYSICLSRQASAARAHETGELRALPDTVLMDLYCQMLRDKKLCVLGEELADLGVFARLLRHARAAAAHLRLLLCFQAVIEHGSDVPARLAGEYLRRCEGAAAPAPPRRDAVVRLGLELGAFLSEAGWYADAERVLGGCLSACREPPAGEVALTLECCHRLLNTQSAYCCFPGAERTYAYALSLVGLDAAPPELQEAPSVASEAAAIVGSEESFKKLGAKVLSYKVSRDLADIHLKASGGQGIERVLPQLYKEFSSLYFVRCDYSAAYAWSSYALKLLRHDTPTKITVEVLRACGKACVVKRQFARAGLLMRQAVAVARRAYGPLDPKYAFALLDYGFYLLNIDSILHSVSVYEEALAVLRRVFGERSLHVATAQEDFAYALYVLEYSSGRFYKAKEHAERAIKIIEGLVPADHLLLASAKRVKALILEEIALDEINGHDINGDSDMLVESEALHKAALKLSMMAFGEKNVQTAKHYGNLGRLYQSMHKFQDAEMMHLKAIAIKEELLGPEDYEVGLSIGHLASLYNYHMHMYSAAEKLYFRSISISLKLFGERYSGLEYDYRGLVHVFTQLKKHDKAQFYTQLLHHWHDLRERSKAEQQPSIGEERAIPLHELKMKFFDPDTD